MEFTSSRDRDTRGCRVAEAVSSTTSSSEGPVLASRTGIHLYRTAVTVDLAKQCCLPLSGHQTRSVGRYRGPVRTHMQDGPSVAVLAQVLCVARIPDTEHRELTATLTFAHTLCSPCRNGCGPRCTACTRGGSAAAPTFYLDTGRSVGLVKRGRSPRLSPLAFTTAPYSTSRSYHMVLFVSTW